MASTIDPLGVQLLTALTERGLASSAELQALAGKSQPSLSRLLSKLSAQGVVTVGRGRKTRYALCQPLLGLVHGQQPLWRHDPDGGVTRWGTLTWLASGQVHVEGQGQEWLERGRLPWFLTPLRLEGYLGRRWARSSHLAQVLGTDLQQWDVEQQLYAAITQLHDGPGAFTLGNPTGGPALTLDAQDEAQRGLRYDKLVAEESEQPLAGSSAAGEQAKFLVDVQVKPGDRAQEAGWRSLIVKFAPAPRGTPFGDRWHDLLHAEALALHTLAEAGEPVAPDHVVETARRSYLESSRFDRTPRHGRRHAVALTSIHEAFVPGARQHWPATCQILAGQKLLSQNDVQRARLWWTFGPVDRQQRHAFRQPEPVGPTTPHGRALNWHPATTCCRWPTGRVSNAMISGRRHWRWIGRPAWMRRCGSRPVNWQKYSGRGWQATRPALRRFGPLRQQTPSGCARCGEPSFGACMPQGLREALAGPQGPARSTLSPARRT